MKTITFVLLAVFASGADPEFTADGKLVKPKNYREWIYLSSGLGMQYSEPGATPNPNPNFENVFVEPSAYRKFVETGRWPDKSVFVLEIRNSANKGSINKDGRFQSGIALVEVSVKDVKRFDDEWGYFGFNGSATTASKFEASAGCNACHSKNAAVEHTFVQFYPTLLEIAKAKGTLNQSYAASEKK
jgi:Cytochrome P460